MFRRFVFVTTLFVFSIFYSFGQTASLNSSARMFLNELRQSIADPEKMAQLIIDYDIIRINGKYYIGVLALVNEDDLDISGYSQLALINDSQLKSLWSIRVPINNFHEFISLRGVEYIEVGEPVSPFLERELPSARIDSVHSGLGGLSNSYKGNGVVVAIIDWGFDYTHPVFYDSTLTNLRIVRAWDQNKLSGPPPSGYSFGTEYIGHQQLLAAGTDTTYVFGPISHGTHVAGIAGGSGGGTIYKGAAPEAELIFVSLRRDAPSLIDAFSYITNYAASVGKPFVVNMSFGSHLGPHDGTSLKNLGIDILHGPGKVFVGSAGNNGGGNSRFHLERDFSLTPGDTLKSVVGFANVDDMFGQTLSMWGSANSDFSVALRLVDNSNQLIYETPYYHSLQEPLLIDTIVTGTDSLIIRIQSTAKHFLNDKPNIRLEVKKTGSNKLVLLVTSENTHLHIWNNVRMNSRYTNWGVPLTSNYPGAEEGNSEFGLGEPAGVGRNVITVGSYRAEMFHNNNWYLGHLSSFSSQGPTVDYRTKPDIASTGDIVTSSVNSFDYTQSDFVTTVEFNGVTYGFRNFSGTSMSAPMVTGIVTLMLQANPKLSATEAKEILKATARLDQHTGIIDSAGHLRWGWGKANALAAVKAAELLVKSPEISITENLFNIYPNPASNSITLSFDNSMLKLSVIEILSQDGKLVKRLSEDIYCGKTLDLSSLPSGIYIVRGESDKKFYFRRLVIAK